MAGFKGGKNWGIHFAEHPNMYGKFFTNMDIALAPLEPNEFNDSKSEIKLAECGRYGVPLVASNVGCYDEWIINGETGFLIDPSGGRSAWTKVLSRVAKDKSLRDRMGKNLRKIVNEHFDVNKTSRVRLDLIKQQYGLWKQDITKS